MNCGIISVKAQTCHINYLLLWEWTLLDLSTLRTLFRIISSNNQALKAKKRNLPLYALLNLFFSLLVRSLPQLHKYCLLKVI